MPDLRVARPDTIRTRLEAIRHRAVCRYPSVACDRDSLTYHQLCAGCADYVDAVAALDLMDNVAERLKTIQFALTVDEHVAAARTADVALALLGVPDPERDAK